MAYTHQQVEVEVQRTLVSGAPTGGDGVMLSVTTVVGRWSPGCVPHLIRMASVRPLVTTFQTNNVDIKFNIDTTTPGTPTTAFTINLPTTVNSHSVCYHQPTRLVEIKPGQELSINPGTAGAGQAKVMLLVEPRWEVPGNVTGMIQTT